jgi:hypothetical protein
MSEEAGGDANGAPVNDPVDVIIEKLLRYDSTFCCLQSCGAMFNLRRKWDVALCALAACSSCYR